MNQKEWEEKARALIGDRTGDELDDQESRVAAELWVRDNLHRTTKWSANCVKSLIQTINILRDVHLVMVVMGDGGCVDVSLPDNEADVARLVNLFSMAAGDLADSISKAGVGCGHRLCVLKSIHASIGEIMESEAQQTGGVSAPLH